MKKQLLVAVGKYGLGLGLLAFVVWRNWRPENGLGIADVLERPLKVLPLILSVVILFFAVFLTFIRWFVLVRAQELPFTLSNAVRLGLVGYFFNTFLPGAVGGDVFKAAFLAREQNRRTAAVSTVLLDRFIGLWGLFWQVAILGTAFWVFGNSAVQEYRSLQIVVLGAIAVAGTTVLGWLLLGVLSSESSDQFAARLQQIPRVGPSVAELWRAVWMYRCKSKSVALALGLTLVGHCGGVLAFYFAVQTFQVEGSVAQIPSLSEHFLIFPVGATIQSVFPTPGGVGGGEYSFGKLYEMVGKPEANGVLGALVGRLITWCLGLIGYLVSLRMRPSVPDRKQDGRSETPSNGTGRWPGVERAVA